MNLYIFLTSTLFSLDQKDLSGPFLLKASSADSSNEPCVHIIIFLRPCYYNLTAQNNTAVGFQNALIICIKLCVFIHMFKEINFVM